MENPICPVNRLDCKLIDYPLVVTYEKLSLSHLFLAMQHNIVFTGVILKKKEKRRLKPIYLVYLLHILARMTISGF